MSLRTMTKLYDLAPQVTDRMKEQLLSMYGTEDIVEVWLIIKGAFKRLECPKCKTRFGLISFNPEVYKEDPKCEYCDHTAEAGFGWNK